MGSNLHAAILSTLSINAENKDTAGKSAPDLHRGEFMIA